MEPGKVGIWWSGTCPVPTGSTVQRPPRWNRWAMGALWCSGGFDLGFPNRYGWLLDATEHIPVARATAREYAAVYFGLPNYANNLRSLGFDDDDLEGGGSDRLVDAVAAWGGTTTITERVRAFHDAGADHVCVQLVADRSLEFPLDAYRELAATLPGG